MSPAKAIASFVLVLAACADSQGDDGLMLQLQPSRESRLKAARLVDKAMVHIGGKDVAVEKWERPLEVADKTSPEIGPVSKSTWISLTRERAAQDPTGILLLVAPEARACCETEKWDQYAICKSALSEAKSKQAAAFSFGVLSYDIWGQYLNEAIGVVPRLYDCFDQHQPTKFKNIFEPVCLGATAGERSTNKGSKSFETLPRLLDLHAGDAPALVKIDVEESEYEVLEALEDHDFDRLGSIHIEYHMNPGGYCPDQKKLDRWMNSIAKVNQRFAVVDAWANFYDLDVREDGLYEKCLVGGKEWPRLLTVSYAARSTCEV